MKDFIFPFKTLIVIIFLLLAFMGIQILAFDAYRRNIKISEGQFIFESWSKHQNAVRLNLDRNGVKAWTEDTDVILGYLKNPRPLTCSVKASGRATCLVPK